MKCSVVIATCNRADDLRQTLTHMATLEPTCTWEVVVVDNNSTDRTADVVRELAVHYPVPLRYVFEREQGRSAALNAGIAAATGEVIATTDDDVRVAPDWIDQAVGALDRFACDYVGGKVLPIWGGPRPAWLPDHGGRHWAVIALLDYGAEPKPFGTQVPLGVNMSFRREAFDRAGLWDNRVGRKAGTLLGQEVREWCLRGRAAGLVGYYVPDLRVRHIIPASRLNKRYFRRWFYWRGISRALLYQQQGLDMEKPEQTALDSTRVPHVAGVPRYLFRTLARNVVDLAKAAVRRDPVATFEHELWLFFFAGIATQRWKDRHKPLTRAATIPPAGTRLEVLQHP